MYRWSKILFSNPFPKKLSDYESQKSGFGFDLKNPPWVWILWIHNPFLVLPPKNAKSVYGFENPDIDFPNKTHPERWQDTEFLKKAKQKIARAYSSTIKLGIEAKSSNDHVQQQQQQLRKRSLKEKQRYLSPEMWSKLILTVFNTFMFCLAFSRPVLKIKWSREWKKWAVMFYIICRH